MSDYGSDYHVTSERNRRWLPSKPWNRQPLSPTLPVAKLRLYKDLALRVLSKSLTELPSHYYYRHLALSTNSSSALSSSRSPSSLSTYRPSSVISHSSSAPMDRVTFSYPGTPTKSYGYHQQHLSTLASNYGRPSSVNLNTHPSSRYSPDPYLQHTIGSVGGSGGGTWSLGSHRQSSSYSDRHYPISPSTIARRNVTLPVSHHPSISRTSALPGLNLSRRSPEPYGTTTSATPGEGSLREQIKNGLKYFADERKRQHQLQLQQQQQQYTDNLYHSDHDLRYIPTNLSSPYNLTSGGSYGHGSVVGTPSIPTPSLRSQLISSYTTRTRQHRSESDLDALFNLYSHVPDPVIERRPLPGVSRVGGIPHTDTLPLPLQTPYNPYLQRNASFPSIPLPSSPAGYGPTYGQGQPNIHPQHHTQTSAYYNQHHLHPSYQQHHNHQQQLQSIEHQRYAQSNPYTIYPGYGSATATHNRYSRSLDRYYN